MSQGHFVGLIIENPTVRVRVYRKLLFNFQGLIESTEYTHGGVAQLGEHLPCKQGVMGSNPIISTTVCSSGG